MKQQKFLFVDLVSSIFLLILLIGNFMGLLYITNGSVAMSSLISMVLVVCYFFVIDLLKKNKEAMIKAKYIHFSLLFWIFFVLLSGVSFVLMSHSINVEYNSKERIKSEASEKINLVDSIKQQYEKRSKDVVQDLSVGLKAKLQIYKTGKSNILRNELSAPPYSIGQDVLANPAYINVDDVVNANMAPMETKIDNNIKNIDSTIGRSSGQYKSIFVNWKRLSLVEGYSKLNEYVDANLKMINEKLRELPLKRTPIILAYNRSQLPLNNPVQLKKLYSPGLTIPIVIITALHLFILIPFFTQKIRGGYNRSGVTKRVLDPLEVENVRVI